MGGDDCGGGEISVGGGVLMSVMVGVVGVGVEGEGEVASGGG